MTADDLPPPGELLDAAVTALGGTPREGQRQMVEAVTAAIDAGRHLLVQAGTGTGKSLGYLVPAVRHAVAVRRPVVVSTATLALQAQVVDRDLPRLAEALAPMLGRRPAFQIVKGRANYVCVHKLVGGFPDDEGALFADPAGSGEGPTSRLGRDVVRLREWAERTDSGDRDELVPGVSEKAWRQVSVTAHECLGSQKCPVAGECFSERARARAREVDVVVTNHAMLAIDAFEGRQLLPDHDVVVVDEAHELADRVTSVVTDQLTPGTVATAAAAARRHAGVDTTRLDAAGQDLEAMLEQVPDGRITGDLPEGLQVAVASLRDAAREVLSQMKDLKGGDEAQGAHQVARAGVTELFDVAERLAALGDGDVAWVSVRDDGFSVVRRTLHVAPLSVAAALRDKLFGERTVVLTSATLALGGAFDAAAGAVGLKGEGAPPWEGIDVGSPFDYPRQAVLYVARHLPRPGRDGTAPATMDELAALVEATGGRTLGLFSSRRAAEAAAEAMRERLDVPVLCQGDDSTPTLVRQFAGDAPTCLFGTLSLWQGVDVPGPGCQLVVIDRIPFPRPDDPLASARQEAVSRSGGNGFMTVAATHTALRLAQGAGRLVRSASDRGV
ncbi:MAG: ATP-dependent DNA helicase, partial [Actinomycetes bacterium]